MSNPDHTSSESSRQETQLVLFEGLEYADRPLPELIARRFGFPLARRDEDNVRYYAIQDWIRGVAQTDVTASSELWRLMKRRLKKAKIETRSWCTSLGYRASDGKTYKRDHATDAGLYLITQHLKTDTGIRNQVLDYLARAGVIVDEIRRDPSKAFELGRAAYELKGKDDRWIRSRIEGKFKRNLFTAALQAALADPQPVHFALATDDVSVGLFERTTAKLKAELGLPKDVNLREYLSDLALSYLSIAESIIAQRLGAQTELTWDEADAIIVQVAALIRPQVQATSEHLGIDVATGKPLLKGP